MPLPSDGVEEDYRNSLEDLANSSRYEISNLTVIAKENTEHASAISRVLENHIKKSSPNRKLPALYLLDSIVKNVGTPYTIFFGRNLYDTFMQAYTLVDAGVRKKLDEMLTTWKEPVPGSLDPRPVFPPETTRPIENALIKARTAFVQQQQQQQFRSQQEMARGRGMPTPMNGYRNTPTPPQANGQFRPPLGQGFPQSPFPQQAFPQQQYANGPPNGNFQNHSPYPQYPQHPPPQQAPMHYQPAFHQQQPPQPQYPPPSGPNLGILHRDIDTLIRSHEAESAAKVYDADFQNRLKALRDLQTVMRNGQLPPEAAQAVRSQLDGLMDASRASAAPPAPVPAPHNPPHFHPQHVPVQPPLVQTPVPAPDLSALFSQSNNLAEIIAKAQRASATPPVAQATLAQTLSTPAPAPNPTPAPVSAASDLMARLRAAGLVTPDTRTPTNGALPFIAPPIVSKRRPGPVIDVQLTSASLKVPRPQLISYLYESQPNQCATCGRRFLATEDGRAKKARHLDWHFRTNQRMADATNRGQSRSWYVDEMEWIKSRDDPEATTDAFPSLDPNFTSAGSKARVIDPKTRYIPVPSDQQLASLPCPICQEKFDTVWNDEAQDFVWMDAVKVGSRVYHASCYYEVRREEGARTPIGAGGRTGTPDSVLGKRKAENVFESITA